MDLGFGWWCAEQRCDFSLLSMTVICKSIKLTVWLSWNRSWKNCHNFYLILYEPQLCHFVEVILVDLKLDIYNKWIFHCSFLVPLIKSYFSNMYRWGVPKWLLIVSHGTELETQGISLCSGVAFCWHTREDGLLNPLCIRSPGQKTDKLDGFWWIIHSVFPWVGECFATNW